MARPLKKSLLEAAALYNISVEIGGGRYFEIVLDAPPGFRFEDELHSLVNAQWDRDTVPTIYRRAINDVKNYGPRLERCPDNCPCREID